MAKNNNNHQTDMKKLFDKLNAKIEEDEKEIPKALHPFEYYNKKRELSHDKILKQFLMAKKLEGCSAKTLESYRYSINYFLKTVNKDITKITTSDIRTYMMEYQRIREIKSITMDSMRRVFSSFFNWLEDEDIIIKSPCRKIHHIKYEKTIQKIFTEEEIERIRDACTTIRDLALIDFLNSSGVRVSELCQLNIEDIDFQLNEGIVFGKGAKERIIYFDSRTKVHLQRYLNSRIDDCPALFVNIKPPIRRLSPNGVEFIVREIGNIANVDDCHPHRFRRTLATRLIDRGVPIEQVQKILGHSKIDTTLIYAQVNQQNVKLSHSKFCS